MKEEKQESPLARARRLAVHAITTLEELHAVMAGLNDIYVDADTLDQDDADSIREEYTWVDKAGAWGDILKRVAKTIEDSNVETALWDLRQAVVKIVGPQLDAERADKEARRKKRING